MEEEIEYRQSIASISSPVAAVFYDDDDKDDDIRGYQRRLIASVKVTSAVKVNILAIALDNVPTPCNSIAKERHSEMTATKLS